MVGVDKPIREDHSQVMEQEVPGVLATQMDRPAQMGTTQVMEALALHPHSAGVAAERGPELESLNFRDLVAVMELEAQAVVGHTVHTLQRVGMAGRAAQVIS